ncbi:GYF domain-containing protein [Luteolibacter sp. GHJ8]|uniref:GYF domain-containing protein n=1 Tax=Luteolibacter rhizosphaerae TaxID=2989719 RepID=A0ABT3FXR2_9BACT|nr:GYF domain-containing protein [Luteolibacter rhizosphaerae]MCW1912364.1 GYF domain-containing protein [Luteolibacter rhizosphaerae]
MNWYYAKNGAQQGPISLEDMKSRIAMGEIGDSELAWREGMSDWMPVGTIAELKPTPPAPAEDRSFAAPASSTPAFAPTTSAPVQTPAATQEPYRTPVAAPAPGQPMAHSQPPSQGLAIGSLICGILSLIGCCVWPLMLVVGLVAIILGFIGLSKAKGDPARYAGKGMARTGIITGILGLIASGLMGAFALSVKDLSPEEVQEKIIQMMPLNEEQRNEIRREMEKNKAPAPTP